MTDDELLRLRYFYQSLLGQQDVLKGVAAKQPWISTGQFHIFWDEVSRINSTFPHLLPAARVEDFFTEDMPETYEVYSIQSYIATALPRMRVCLETQENTPVTETRDFSFIKDQDLKNILERDYIEIQRSYIARCWKSVIILSGGAIEAILMDLLLQKQSAALAATKAPRGKTDISRWDLADLIHVSVELELVTNGVEKLSHPVRDYRNLVHPGNEIRNKLVFSGEEAKIAVEVLHIVHRDLS